MAWSSAALRNAVERNLGLQILRNLQPRLSCALHSLLTLQNPSPLLRPASPSCSPMPSDGHDGPAPQLSNKSRDWYPISMEISEETIKPTLGEHRRMNFGFASKLSPSSQLLDMRRPLTVGLVEVNSVHLLCQMRNISSTRHQSLPRKSERNFLKAGFRVNTELIEKRSRLPAAQRLPESEYRQVIIQNSTKDMAIVPKKWKRAIPSREVVDAVSYLRRAKRNPDAVKQVLQKRVGRLLKLELMLVLLELQRVDEWLLARQVFNAIRKESWYKPDVYIYQTMVKVFAKNKQIKEAENMMEELKAEGLQPDDSIKRELLRGYVICNMIPTAVEYYKDIQKGGLDRAARSILFHGLNDEEKAELSVYEKQQGYDWS